MGVRRHEIAVHASCGHQHTRGIDFYLIDSAINRFRRGDGMEFDDPVGVDDHHGARTVIRVMRQTGEVVVRGSWRRRSTGGCVRRRRL